MPNGSLYLNGTHSVQFNELSALLSPETLSYIVLLLHSRLLPLFIFSTSVVVLGIELRTLLDKHSTI
jgi:hypothetical protein